MDHEIEKKLSRCRAGEDQPIGNSASEEEKAKKLAQYRVGKDKPMGKDMTAEQIDTRRQFIKTMFMRVDPWKDLKGEQIDDVRIYKVGSDWYVQDQDYYTYPF
jgi:hypothetical protein